MGSFKVEGIFFHPARDSLVLTGEIVEPPVDEGMWMDLSMEGPAQSVRVPISSMEYVRVQNGPDKLAAVIRYGLVEAIPDWDWTGLEGRTVDVLG